MRPIIIYISITFQFVKTYRMSLNGVVLWTITYDTVNIRHTQMPYSPSIQCRPKMCNPSPEMIASSYKYDILKQDEKQYMLSIISSVN